MWPIEMKACTKCRIEKPMEEFYEHPGYRDGRRARCRPCHIDDAAKQASRRLRRDNHYRHKYGISLADYEALNAAQGGLCLSCEQPETAIGNGGEVMALAVDHDHATGAIRGLLCRNCNITLGRHDDDPEVFDNLARYLRRAMAW